MLYASSIQASNNNYYGILAASLSGINAICLNKSVWKAELRQHGSQIKYNFNDLKDDLSKEFWGDILYKWGYAKVPGSVYSLNGMSLWMFQHAVLNSNILKKLQKEYNKKINKYMKYAGKEFLIKDEYFKKPNITALFRRMLLE